MAQNPVRMTITPEVAEEIKRSIDWARVDAMSDEDIARQNAADIDASPFSDAEFTAIRVQDIRKRTGLSQPDFAKRFRIPVGTLRDWEQGRRMPESPALAYLRVIEFNPDAVIEALAEV